MNTGNIIQLSDGKQLCYAEFGDPQGEPVLLFHGNPGARLSWGLYPGSPFLNNIRIIAPDRPGYGRTEFKRNALEKWPYDIVELADYLDIEKFVLFAPSGGGPFALACAWKIPERFLSIGLFGSLGPYTKESVKGVNKPLKILWSLANPLFPLVRFQNKLMARRAKKDPYQFYKIIRDLELSEYDRQIADKPDISRVFYEVFPESYLQDGIGSAYDVTLPKNWKIPLQEIRQKIFLWQATEDCLSGQMTQYLADQLPDSELIIIPGAGHFWIVEHVGEVFEKLVSGKN